MLKLSCDDRSTSVSSSPGQNGSFEVSFGEAFIDLVDKANSLNILKLFKFYHIRLDSSNTKAICPFHRDGHETSPSMCVYAHTNTFHCFACKAGSRPVDFVALKEKVSIYVAASRIISLFSGDLSIPEEKESVSEKLEILTLFSSKILELRKTFSYDKNKFVIIEQTCQVLDLMYDKYELNNNSLRFLVDNLLRKLNEQIFDIR